MFRSHFAARLHLLKTLTLVMEQYLNVMLFLTVILEKLSCTRRCMESEFERYVTAMPTITEKPVFSGNNCPIYQVCLSRSLMIISC
jgi:hypothetical protein